MDAHRPTEVNRVGYNPDYDSISGLSRIDETECKIKLSPLD